MQNSDTTTTARARRSAEGFDAGVGRVDAGPVVRLDHFQAGRLEHGLEQPPEGAVLGAQVLGEVLPRVAQRRVGRGAVQPGVQPGGRLAGREVEDQVAQAQYPAGAQDRGDAVQRQDLPEVGELVQGVAGVYRVDRRAGVLVRQEARPHTLDVVE